MASLPIFTWLQIVDPTSIDGAYGNTTLKSILLTDGFYYLNVNVLQSQEVPVDVKNQLIACKTLFMNSQEFNLLRVPIVQGD